MFWRRLKSRRKSPRLQQTLRLPMPWLDCKNQNGASIEGEIVDISEQGFCLRIATACDKDSILTLQIKEEKIQAQVRWCEYVKSEGLYRCGVQLMDGSSRFLDALAQVWSVGD